MVEQASWWLRLPGVKAWEVEGVAWGGVAPAFGVFRAAGRGAGVGQTRRRRCRQQAAPQSSVRCGPLRGLSLACIGRALPQAIRALMGSAGPGI